MAGSRYTPEAKSRIVPRGLMKGNKRNMSIAEAGEYYDAHDLFESGEAVEIKDIKFKRKPEPSRQDLK
jgi:hypothetical protein